MNGSWLSNTTKKCSMTNMHTAHECNEWKSLQITKKCLQSSEMQQSFQMHHIRNTLMINNILY